MAHCTLVHVRHLKKCLLAMHVAAKALPSLPNKRHVLRADMCSRRSSLRTRSTLCKSSLGSARGGAVNGSTVGRCALADALKALRGNVGECSQVACKHLLRLCAAGPPEWPAGPPAPTAAIRLPLEGRTAHARCSQRIARHSSYLEHRRRRLNTRAVRKCRADRLKVKAKQRGRTRHGGVGGKPLRRGVR